MNTLAVLWGTFGNFGPLSLTTSVLRQSLYKLTITDFERALS